MGPTLGQSRWEWDPLWNTEGSTIGHVALALRYHFWEGWTANSERLSEAGCRDLCCPVLPCLQSSCHPGTAGGHGRIHAGGLVHLSCAIGHRAQRGQLPPCCFWAWGQDSKPSGTCKAASACAKRENSRWQGRHVTVYVHACCWGKACHLIHPGGAAEQCAQGRWLLLVSGQSQYVQIGNDKQQAGCLLQGWTLHCHARARKQENVWLSSMAKPVAKYRNIPSSRKLCMTAASCLQIEAGTTEFTPTPFESRALISQSYRVPRTLLVRFADDSIDATAEIAPVPEAAAS